MRDARCGHWTPSPLLRPTIAVPTTRPIGIIADLAAFLSEQSLSLTEHQAESAVLLPA
jgi:hypothetical protein